ncbi:MAG TPA: hypothetical protein VL202_18510 [Pararhizobium sp.]|uniref:hypothetical protein n=1 Tax=Pararhizobium sp. TaxID=1977563 RepID=UPI002CC74D14|nr:hypothetical protein [Pararhizobium sp.]HTO33146.1 hypothetical protein [Pararhizobium sp.]
MPAAINVLVVAPDEVMRRSLSFVLEAEGYVVDARSRLDRLALTRDGRIPDCVVIDQDAFADPGTAGQDLSGLGVAVILLVEQMHRPPLLPGLRLIEKPPLGRDLLDAVATACQSVGST